MRGEIKTCSWWWNRVRNVFVTCWLMSVLLNSFHSAQTLTVLSNACLIFKFKNSWFCWDLYRQLSVIDRLSETGWNQKLDMYQKWHELGTSRASLLILFLFLKNPVYFYYRASNLAPRSFKATSTFQYRLCADRVLAISWPKCSPFGSRFCRLLVSKNVHSTWPDFQFEKKRKVEFLRHLACNVIITPKLSILMQTREGTTIVLYNRRKTFPPQLAART